MEKKKILFFNHSGEVGGAELSMLSLLTRLKNDYDIVVTAPLNGPLDERVRAMGIEFIPIKVTQIRKTYNPFALFYYLISIFFAAKNLKKVIDEIQPDILHANSIRSGIISAFLKPHYYLIWHVRDILGGGILGRLIQRLARKADKIIHISSFLMFEFCKNNEGLKLKSQVIYNGIDFSVIDQDHQPERFYEEFRLDKNDSQPLIGIIGYIAPLKGQEEFIRAAQGIIKEYPHARFLIAGDVIFRRVNRRFFKRLKSLVSSDPNLRGRVYFTGYYQDVYLLMKSMDIIIQPSWIEGWGRTVCEGFACNRPVVCSNVGGIPEIVRYGKEYFLTRVKDVGDIINKVNYILNNSELIEDLVEKNSSYVRQEFTLENHVQNIKEIYEAA